MIRTLTIVTCLVLLSFFAPVVSANDQPVHIFADMRGLAFETPFFASQLLNKSLFKNLLLVPPISVQIQTTSSKTLALQTKESTQTAVQTLPTIPNQNIIIAKTPTPTPVPTATPTPNPTSTPTPTPATEPTPATASPTPIYQLSSGGLSGDKIFELTNVHRQNKGLPPYEKDSRACEVASSRAPELAGEFKSGHYHQGIRARNLPYWNHENIINTRSEEGALAGWLSDSIHQAGIEGSYKYSCVACSGNNCVAEYTNFVNKR